MEFCSLFDPSNDAGVDGGAVTANTTQRQFDSSLSDSGADSQPSCSSTLTDIDSADIQAQTDWHSARRRHNLLLSGLNCLSADSCQQLPPEPQTGNVEYKLKLLAPSQQRFEHLVTQMKWRLREGSGEAIYAVGVHDSGRLVGLSAQDMRQSLSTLHCMAERLGATVSLLRQRPVPATAGGAISRVVTEVLVRKIPDDDRHDADVRVAVVGSADAGKSSLLGVLTHGRLDNGRGSARLNMLRHLHEIRSGRTSSVSHEILGFDAQGNTIDYSNAVSSDDICERSTRLLTFFDLAGHRKYLKTTVSALSGYSPHHVMMVVAASTGVKDCTRQHLTLALALQVPLVIVITKTDVTSRTRWRHTLLALETVLAECGVPSLRVRSQHDLAALQQQQAVVGAANTSQQRGVGGVIVAVLSVSCVSGAGLPLLKQYLFMLCTTTASSTSRPSLTPREQELCEFQIDETYRISESGVVVVGGLLTAGVVAENMLLLLGPVEDGSFVSVHVGSMQRNRRACGVVRAGQTAALALDGDVSRLRRGMVLLSPRSPAPRGCFYFQALVRCVSGGAYMQRRCASTVHVGSVCQTALVEAVLVASSAQQQQEEMHMGNTVDDSMTQKCCNTTVARGDGVQDEQEPVHSVLVLFRFVRRPEYVRCGQRVLVRQSRGYGVGRVTRVFVHDGESAAETALTLSAWPHCDSVPV